MPLLGTTPLLLGEKVARFIGENHYATDGSAKAVAFPAGALAGDLALMIGVQESFAAPSGWTSLGAHAWGAAQTVVYYKVLSSADITAGSVTTGATVNGGVILLVVYRGPTSAAIVSSAVSSTSSVSCAGFTKSGVSRALVTYVANGGNGTGITAPPGTTTRVSPFTSSVEVGAVADFLPSSLYTNGQAITWSGLVAAANNAESQVIELT